jgi:hypothetical protein
MKVQAWLGVGCGEKHGPLDAELVKLHEDGRADILITDEVFLDELDWEPMPCTNRSSLEALDGFVPYDDFAWSYIPT